MEPLLVLSAFLFRARPDSSSVIGGCGETLLHTIGQNVCPSSKTAPDWLLEIRLKRCKQFESLREKLVFLMIILFIFEASILLYK